MALLENRLRCYVVYGPMPFCGLEFSLPGESDGFDGSSLAQYETTQNDWGPACLVPWALDSAFRGLLFIVLDAGLRYAKVRANSAKPDQSADGIVESSV